MTIAPLILTSHVSPRSPLTHLLSLWEAFVNDLIQVGSTAPDFELAASDGKTYRLSDVLKRQLALLVFYPGNDTPG